MRAHNLLGYMYPRLRLMAFVTTEAYSDNSQGIYSELVEFLNVTLSREMCLPFTCLLHSYSGVLPNLHYSEKEKHNSCIFCMLN